MADSRIKAKITKDGDIYHVYFCTGIPREYDIDELKEYLGDFDNPKYYTASYTLMFSIEFNDMVGTSIAYVDGDYNLVIENASLFKEILNHNKFNYISADEYAKKHNKSKPSIKKYCQEGRIKGVIQVGNMYLIPEDADYPKPQKRGRPFLE